MKSKLHVPFWTHVPVLAMFITVIVYTVNAGPLPSRLAIHFSFKGIPNGYGSLWLVLGLTLGISLIMLAVSVIFDEAWARQEKKKSFNWFSLMDELTMGFMGGVYIGWIGYIKAGSVNFNFPWMAIGISIGILLILAVILELFRPFNPGPNQAPFGDTEQVQKELERRLKDDTFIYWQSQNPFWVTLLTLGMPLLMVICAVVVGLTAIWWAGLIIVVSGLPVIIAYGGMRVSVSREMISVSFGMLARVMRIKPQNIASVELREFSPMRDFAGAGLRFNKEMTAYFLRGTRGVLLTTNKGKKHLIGSDNPEELYAVIQAVMKHGTV